MASAAGRAAGAATAAIGSFVAGTIATIALAGPAAPLVVKVALQFGPADYFALMVLGLHDRSPRCWASRRCAAWRSLLHRAGASAWSASTSQTGQARFDLRHAAAARRHRRGRSSLSASSRSARRSTRRAAATQVTRSSMPIKGPLWMKAEDWTRSWRRGCAAPRSAFRSARSRPAAPRSRPSCPTPSRRSSRSTRKSSAHGAIEGVAGPEAANNASAAGTMVPLLTLGFRPRPRRRSCLRRSSSTACSRVRCCSRSNPRWCGA